MFKFPHMEISIIDSIKLPSVSISKICTYRAFPDRSLNSLKPGDILKIIHSNLFSSSTYVITCIERIKPLGLHNIWKMTISQYGEMALASWRLQPWATRPFVQEIIQTHNKANTKAPHHWVLWEPRITGGSSSQMGRWCGNRHWYYDSYSTHCGAIWRYKSVNTDSGNGLLPDGTKPLPKPVLTCHR